MPMDASRVSAVITMSDEALSDFVSELVRRHVFLLGSRSPA